MHVTDSRPKRVCGESQLSQGSDYVAVSAYRVRDSALRQCAPLSRAADRESFDPERRLDDADRHALPILAAGSNTVVEFQVVADHRDARQHIGTIADQGGALEGCAHAAVLDGIRLARREHELARSEEHTSELQSQFHLVCRLLLAKKKKKIKHQNKLKKKKKKQIKK